MENKCRHTLQRLLALVLCAAMLLPVITPQAVHAEEATTSIKPNAVVAEGVVGSDYGTGTAKTSASKQIYLDPLTSTSDDKMEALIHHGRYVLMNSTREYILSYDAISNSGEAQYARSLTYDADGNSENTFYFASDKSGTKLDLDPSKINRKTEHYLVLDHSDRDTALWVLRSYNIHAKHTQTTNYGGLVGENWHDVGEQARALFVRLNRSSPDATDGTGNQMYMGIELQKGRFGKDLTTYTTEKFDFDPGYDGRVTTPQTAERPLHGYYWYTPPITDLQTELTKHFPHFCYRSDSFPFKNISENAEMVRFWYQLDATYNRIIWPDYVYKSDTNPITINLDEYTYNGKVHDNSLYDKRKFFRIERTGYNQFVFYFILNEKEGQKDYRFIYCDENGFWSVRRYMQGDNIGDGAFPWNQMFEDKAMLTHYLYEYPQYGLEHDNSIDIGKKKVQFEGYQTFDVVKGMSAEDVVETIQKNITVFDPAHQNQHIPGNDMEAKVGYYYLKCNKAQFEAALKYGTTTPFTITVAYRNDNGPNFTDTDVATLKINVSENPSTTIRDIGIISKGSSFSDVVYVASPKNDGTYESTFDHISLNVHRGLTTELTAKNLYTLVDGEYQHINTDVTGLRDVHVIYGGQYICAMKVYVANTTIMPHRPAYPDAGSVAVDKGTTTTVENFNKTADIWLSATGKETDKGIDLLVLVDLSQSMRFGMADTDSASTEVCAPYFAKESYAQNTLWNKTDWEKTRMYAMEQALRKMISSISDPKYDVRVAIADFGDVDHFEFEDAVVWDVPSYDRRWAHFDVNGDDIWQPDIEAPNHLNYVLGPSGTKNAHPYALHYWKYWSTDALNADKVKPELQGKMLPYIYTGETQDTLADAFVDASELGPNKMNDLIRKMRINNSQMLGSNYDVGLELAYKMAYERRQENIKDGVDRDIVCIFMSDGAPVQYNYFSGHKDNADWAKYLTGDLINSDGTDEIKQSSLAYAATGDGLTSANGIVPPRNQLHMMFKELMHWAHVNGMSKSGIRVIDIDNRKSSKLINCNHSGTNAYGEHFQTCFKEKMGHDITWLELLSIPQLNPSLSCYYQDPNTGNVYNVFGQDFLRKAIEFLSYPSTDGNYETFSPYTYFYNKDGKNWWAEAMKGQIDQHYPVINKFARAAENEHHIYDSPYLYPQTATSRSYYNGKKDTTKAQPFNNFSGTTTQGLDLSGKDYISGFVGLDMKIYTVGVADFNDSYITKDVKAHVLKSIATTEGYVTNYFPSTTVDGLTANMDTIVGRITSGARQLYYTDTMGEDYNLLTTSGKTIKVVERQVNSNGSPTDANGNLLEEVKTIETITFYAGKIAKSSLLGDIDIWDDTTNLIKGRYVIYNANTSNVNSGDTIVNGKIKIDMTGDGVPDVWLAPETFFWTIGNLPTHAYTLEYSVELVGKDGSLPIEYRFYDTNEEAVLHYIDYRGNNCTLNTVSPKFPYGSSGYEDIIVVDYGIPVSIDVLANDHLFIGYKNTLCGVSTKDDISYITNESTVPNADFFAAGTGTSGKILNDQFGGISFANNEVIYTPRTMKLDSVDKFTYAFTTSKDNVYHYGAVTVIPATNIYYEDNFKAADGNSYISYSAYQFWTENNVVISKDITAGSGKDYVEADHKNLQWVDAGTAITNKTQNEDRPGESDIEGIDANNVYGYDGSYTTMGNYSMGSAKMFTASKDANGKVTYGSAQFQFTGTGFDVISVTSGVTGTITVKVTYKDANGKDVSVKNKIVDTYYGYKRNEETGKWTPVGSNETDVLYQVPVIKISGMPCRTYDVTITVSYNEIFDHNKSGSYDFYLDAIRIYDPVNDGVTGNPIVDETIQDAYIADGEGWPEYFELRNLILARGDLDYTNNDSTVSVPGIVFIDNTNATNEYDVADYKNYGPNNELYLASGQAITFDLHVPSTESYQVASIQIALKSVCDSAKVRIYDYKTGDNILPSPKNSDITTISTATDLYYDITDLNNKTVVITNAGGTTDGILSITNVKVTYTAEHSDSLEKSYFNSFASKVMDVVDSFNETQEEDSSVPTTNDGIAFKSATLSLEDEVLVNFYFTIDTSKITVSSKDDVGLLTWYSEPAEGMAGYNSADGIVNGALYDEANGRYMVHTTGIPAKNMGDDLYVRVYVKQNDGSYKYGKVLSYNPTTYAYNRLTKSSDAKMKALCVALLNYGAAAQTYFGYRTDSLMNADLTDVQKALVAAYSGNLFPGAKTAPVTDAKMGDFKATKEGFDAKSASVSFEGAFAINYYFKPSKTVEGDVTFYYWTAEKFNNNTTLTKENASGSFTAKKTNDGRYWAEITGIAAQDIDDVFYTAAVYSDGTNTYSSGVNVYSVSKYCVSKAGDTNTNLAVFAKATAMYGYYAKQYFDSLEG